MRTLQTLIVTALALTACQETPTTAPTPAKPTSPPGHIKLPKPPSVEGLGGGACVVDRDCPLYLRCLDDRCAVPPAVKGEGATEATPAMSLTGSQGEAQFYLELATDGPQRTRGLMFRPEMSDSWGMLFIYPVEDELTFWMKNTYIPLDMVFIDDSATVVGVVQNAVPHTLSSRKVDGRSRYVLEINAGLAERYGIAKGSKVGFTHLPPGLSPHRR